MLKSQSYILNKKKNPELLEAFDTWTKAGKEVFNFALFVERQLFSSVSKDRDKWSENEKAIREEMNSSSYTELPDSQKSIGYKKLDRFIRDRHYDIFEKELPNQSIQYILKAAVHDIDAFFKAVKSYNANPSAFTGEPKLPHYRKSEHKSITISNQDCVLRKFSNHWEMKFPYTKVRYIISELPENFKRLKEVQIIPFYDTYKIEMVYEAITKEKPRLNAEQVAAIDPGIDNLVTLVANDESLVINGRIIKSKNQWFNKRSSELKSLLDDMHGDSDHEQSKQLTSLWKKRANWMNDYMHKVSRFIVNYCIEKQISTLVLGKNEQWKTNSNIGKTNNQNFVQIPHATLYKLIQYKAEEVGIKVIYQEESYTSKASYLDGDTIPVYTESQEYIFSGKRIKRGLYRTKDGILLNADVNGAANIYRKQSGTSPFTKGTLQKVKAVTIRP